MYIYTYVYIYIYRYVYFFIYYIYIYICIYVLTEPPTIVTDYCSPRVTQSTGILLVFHYVWVGCSCIYQHVFVTFGTPSLGMPFCV